MKSGSIRVLMQVTIIIALAWPACAWTQERHFDLTVYAGLRAGGSFEDEVTHQSLSVDETTAYGLSLDMDVDDNGQIQLFWARQETQFKTAGLTANQFKLNIDYYHFGGTYSWIDDDKLKPYVGCSIGATHFLPSESDYDDALRFSASLGLGLKYFITPHLGIMVEGRGYGTVMGGSGEIFCGKGSCRIEIDQELLTQVEGRAGIVLRY